MTSSTDGSGEGSERHAALQGRLGELDEEWSHLISETDQRHSRLQEANRAQQFYADAAEAEAWMGEQELHMMSEEKAKVCACICVSVFRCLCVYLLVVSTLNTHGSHYGWCCLSVCVNV